jgi:hypothetical protein
MIAGRNFTGSKYRSRQPPTSRVTFTAVSCLAAGLDAAETGVLAQDAEQGVQQVARARLVSKKQGSVRRHRIIISTTVLLALSGVIAPVALGDPLLSGYGSPGEGSQALIGATLVNGPRGGGGSGGGGGGASTGEGAVNLAAPAASSGSSGSSAATRGGSASKSGSARGSGAAGSSGSGAPGARTPSAGRSDFASYPRSERVVGAQTSLISGVSGSDLLYVLIALGCLLLTVFATLRLAKRTVRPRV